LRRCCWQAARQAPGHGAFDTPVLGGVVAGSVAGSEDVVVRTEPLSVPPKGGVSGSAVSSLRTAAAPAIPGCAA